MKRVLMIMVIAMFALLLAACSESEEQSTTPIESANNGQNVLPKVDMSKPLQLTFYSQIDTTANDDDFEKEFGQYIKKKYPNITFANLYQSQTKSNLSETVAAGITFDFTQMSLVATGQHLELDVVGDISDLFKTHNIDTSAINSVVLDQLRDSGGGQLIGLPYQVNSQILFYNKTIFDRFAVPYPKDNMSWEDITNLVRRVTRQHEGVDYKGFAFQQGASIFVRSNQLAIEPLELPGYKATFLKDDRWKTFFDSFRPMFQIQGNAYTSIASVDKAFFQDQTVAMVLAYANFYARLPETMDWDMAAAPSIAGLPGVGMPPVPSTLALSKHSPHRDQAFLVMMEILSKSAQMDRAQKHALASVLNDAEIKQVIGKDVPQLKGKHTAVMQPANMAKSVTFTPYTGTAVNALGRAFNEVMSGTKDVNTALREAEELANQQIETAISGVK